MPARRAGSPLDRVRWIDPDVFATAPSWRLAFSRLWFCARLRAGV